MAQTSWNKLVDYLQAFANAHLQIKEFKSDFEDEMHDWVNELENFPIMWVVPPTNQFDTNVGYYTFKVIVLDRLQEGRGNVTSVVSDAHLILNDLFKYFNESNVFDIDFNIGATGDSLNTPAMEELAGAEVFITAEVESIGDCQIPLEGIVPIPPGYICDPAEYTLKNSNDLTVGNGSIPSGINSIINLEDITYDVYVDGVFKTSVTLPYGEDNEINITAE